MKDRVTVTLDTTGPSLHKRGYRQSAVAAPIKGDSGGGHDTAFFLETGPDPGRPVLRKRHHTHRSCHDRQEHSAGAEPSFCRRGWEAIPADLWREERQQAYEAVDWDKPLEIYGYDIDSNAVRAAEENAAEAGVTDDIVFERHDRAAIDSGGQEGGIIITNPPYGERIGDRRSIEKLYAGWAGFLAETPTWSCFVITPDKTIENKVFGRPANRRRKLFNGRLEVCYYQYHGEKPKSR